MQRFFRHWPRILVTLAPLVFALAHAIGDGTVAAYQRSDLFDKRRNLMADWARFINTPPAAGDNVVQLRGVA